MSTLDIVSEMEARRRRRREQQKWWSCGMFSKMSCVQGAEDQYEVRDNSHIGLIDRSKLPRQQNYVRRVSMMVFRRKYSVCEHPHHPFCPQQTSRPIWFYHEPHHHHHHHHNHKHEHKHDQKHDHKHGHKLDHKHDQKHDHTHDHKHNLKHDHLPEACQKHVH